MVTRIAPPRLVKLVAPAAGDRPAAREQRGDGARLRRQPAATRSARTRRSRRTPRAAQRVDQGARGARRRSRSAAAISSRQAAGRSTARATSRCRTWLTQPGPQCWRPCTRATVVSSPASTATRRSGPSALETERVAAQRPPAAASVCSGRRRSARGDRPRAAARRGARRARRAARGARSRRARRPSGSARAG